MATFKDRLPPALRWLGSDEWLYFVLPDLLFVLMLALFLAAR